jgi:pyruvate/2-oxoglutarate dehydrogenase complex dihydrolipoamide dehydrogenase (E3) component
MALPGCATADSGVALVGGVALDHYYITNQSRLEGERVGKSIVVVGAGPAGIAAAVAASEAGGRVTMVSDEPAGGRANWHSLGPSKVWLAAVEAYEQSVGAIALGLTAEAVPPDTAVVLARIRELAGRWSARQAESLSLAGVEWVDGFASLDGPGRVKVVNRLAGGESLLEPDAVILATGSVPYFPEGLRPDGDRVLAPRFAGSLREIPGDVVVIGGGATGAEFVYLFDSLGSEVTWMLDDRGVLPDFPPEAAALLVEALDRRGVRRVQGPAARIERGGRGVVVVCGNGRRYAAHSAFLAVGRLPALGGLAPETVGLAPRPDGTLWVDAYGRTEVPNIYAVGDVAGPPMLANYGEAQGRVAGLHAAGVTAPGFRPETVVHAVYTSPQIAKVGDAEGVAGIGHPGRIGRIRAPFHAGLHALLHPGKGWLELVLEQPEGRIIGAWAVGPGAADSLAPVALAVRLRATAEQMAEVAPAVPTITELPFIAAREAARLTGDIDAPTR